MPAPLELVLLIPILWGCARATGGLVQAIWHDAGVQPQVPPRAHGWEGEPARGTVERRRVRPDAGIGRARYTDL